MIENYLHRREGGQFVPVEIYLYYCTWIIRSAKPTFIMHDGEISLKRLGPFDAVNIRHILGPIDERQNASEAVYLLEKLLL